MERFILWFSVLGFALLFGSLGMTYTVYNRTHPPWLVPYLLYLTGTMSNIVAACPWFFPLVTPPSWPERSRPRPDAQCKLRAQQNHI